jgi:hypothetical protein
MAKLPKKGPNYQWLEVALAKGEEAEKEVYGFFITKL